MDNVVLKELDLREMGKRIRAKREFLQITREQLAEKLGVSSQFISDVEYGHKGLSIKRLYMLCQVLDVSADYILVGKITQIDDEASRFREEIQAILTRCNKEQLKGMTEIARIYEDGTRMR